MLPWVGTPQQHICMKPPLPPHLATGYRVVVARRDLN